MKPLLAFMLVLAAPAAAQSSSCVRGADGSLVCAMTPAPISANAARRQSSSRDLSAAAVARSRAQAEAMRKAMDGVRSDADARAAHRHRVACPGTPPPRSGALPGGAAGC